MKYYCNPINIDYRYQFTVDRRKGNDIQISREAADPSMIFYKGKYYICASMTLGVWVSEDLAHWENYRLPDELPLYDYAPDIRVIGDYVYFCASKRGEICDYYRTQDIVNGPYEKIDGTFDFWDPNLFQDDDGRIYFYWGCSNMTPVWGVELNPDDLRPIGEKKVMITGDVKTKGFERPGEDHSIRPLEEDELEQAFQGFLKMRGMKENDLPTGASEQVKGLISNQPYIEGAWMTKHEGKYYLQYACPGAEYNVYADGVYVSDHPMGPFELAKNNPFSYKPGGFLPGAGHGSTMEDQYGSWWHTSTMRISVNQSFERRVGIWPAGFDRDGELFCNQNYGDWPRCVEKDREDPWSDPEWYLLSYNKKVKASSSEEGKGPERVADENVRTWWRVASAEPGEWLEMDLGDICDVRAVQINFADDKIDIPVPGEIHPGTQPKYIEEADMRIRWVLEGSQDGKDYIVLGDKSQTETNLPHDLVICEEGEKIRYLRLTVLEIPYGQRACVSGLRVFGKGNGDRPEKPAYEVRMDGELDMIVTIDQSEVAGHNILWGYEQDKLYHSYQTFSEEQKIGALVKGQSVYVRVDSFNENGITHGEVKKIR